MFDLSYWIVFFAAALALNLSPGPDLIYILSRTLAQGVRVGIASSIGVCTGALVHVLAAALGLSAVLTASVTAFAVVKYLGAAYLVFLGIQSFYSRVTGLQASSTRFPPVTPMHAFRQAVLVDVLNPKVAVFFIAFLPQFVRNSVGHPAFQLVGLGLLVILVGLIVEVLFVLTAARAMSYFQRNSRVGGWLHSMMGVALIGLGVRLAF